MIGCTLYCAGVVSQQFYQMSSRALVCVYEELCLQGYNAVWSVESQSTLGVNNSSSPLSESSMKQVESMLYVISRKGEKSSVHTLSHVEVQQSWLRPQ
jgi:hypothetical protein